ncbi:LicD family protein [Pelistega sp. MC2]|uniref:LicD family protein n=1 Tax=Pelistega sp. MC2 TaxID=1720297 RepID=UPI0008D9DA92|nr:LicD family protein [Pelistega sp. MC2]
MSQNLRNAFNQTEQYVVDLIYEGLEVVHKVFNKHGIRYTLSGGSLLGLVRHQGLIPWDDDADVMFLQDDFYRILRLEDEFKENGYKTCTKTYEKWGAIKLYPEHGLKMLSGHDDYKHPGIDLFPIKPINDKLLHFSQKTAQNIWPNEYIFINEWKKIDAQRFGDITVLALAKNDAHRYLRVSYGDNYMTHAIKTFDHHAEKEILAHELILSDFKCAYHSRYLKK